MCGGQEKCKQNFDGETCWKETILERLGIILKFIFKKCDGKARIGLIWLRIEKRGGRL
jgi:hypothetical protein